MLHLFGQGLTGVEYISGLFVGNGYQNLSGVIMGVGSGGATGVSAPSRI